MKAVARVTTVADLLAEGAAVLTRAGVTSPSNEAEWLLASILKTDRFRLIIDPDRAVPAECVAEFREWVKRRVAHEPLQHILGFEDFSGLRLKAAPTALIPRPETELLVEWALELERQYGPWRVALDVGAGSGAIACALAAGAPGLTVVAVERSLAALAVAAANVAALGLSAQVRLVAGDLLAPLAELAPSVQLVLSNPPYIPTAEIAHLPTEVRDWEPREALDGGVDGMTVHRRLVAQVSRFLRPGGWLLMEMGEGQAEPLSRLMEASGFYRIEVRQDLRGTLRMIGGRKR